MSVKSQHLDGDPPRNTIPVVDRMMGILGVLERLDSGATIRDLSARLVLPRSTVYRILNTLQGHDMVHRRDNGSYRLGRRLLSLAAHVASSAADFDLAAVSQPFLDRTAAKLGDSVKLSVVDGDGVLVLAVAQGRRAYALTVAPGQRLPLHAGAAGKLLLAHLPSERLATVFSRPLEQLTEHTITDPKRLRAELVRIRKKGRSRDDGESAPGIHAFAAPVTGPGGRVVAALSIPFMTGTAASRMDELERAVVKTAHEISVGIDR